MIMLTFILMPKYLLNQKGLAPLILVIIAGVVITGVVVVSKGSFIGKKPSPNVQTGQIEQKDKQVYRYYSSFDNKISIQIPRDWVLKENPQPGTQATFSSLKEGKDDKFIENIALEVGDLSAKPNATLDEVVKAWTDDAQSDFPDSFKVLSREKTTLGGIEAIKITYQAKDQILRLKGLSVFALKDNKAYLLSYTAEEKSFDKYLSDVEKLLNSVKFEAQKLEWETFESEQYGYSLKYPKGWVAKDQSGEDKREVLVMAPGNLANVLIVGTIDDSLKDKSGMEKAMVARKEFKQAESGFKMGNFDSQIEDKKGGWMMVGEKTIDGKQWFVMERGLLDIYGKVLIEQSGYLLDGGRDYKDVVIQILDSFKVE